MKKRVVSLLLCLIMALSLIPTAAFATEVADVEETTPAVETQAATDEVAVQKGGSINPPSESYFHGYQCFGYDVMHPGSLVGIVSVKVGTVTLDRNKASSTTGDAVDNGITVSLLPGYYIKDYKYVCYDKYECQSDSHGMVTSGGKVEPNADSSSVVLQPKKKDFGHSNEKAPYWLLLNLAEDKKDYTVTYNWGELTGKMEAGVPTDNNKYKVNALVTVQAPSTDAITEATGLRYTFAGWKADHNNVIYKSNDKFGMPQQNVTLTAQWEKVEAPATGSLTIEKVVEGLSDAEKATLLSSLQFTLAKGATSSSVILGNNWVCNFSKLSAGNYTLSETNATVPGYKLTTTYKIGDEVIPTNDDGSISVTVNGGETATITVTNTYEKDYGETVYNRTSLTIVKKDARTGKVLPNVEFTLTGEEGESIAVTNSEGKATFTRLQLGSYTLKETGVPAGYAAWNLDLPILVKANDQPTKEELVGDKFVKTYDCTATIDVDANQNIVYYNNRMFTFEDGALVLFNEPIASVSVDVTKKVEQLGNASGEGTFTFHAKLEPQNSLGTLVADVFPGYPSDIHLYLDGTELRADNEGIYTFQLAASSKAAAKAKLEVKGTMYDLYDLFVYVWEEAGTADHWTYDTERQGFNIGYDSDTNTYTTVIGFDPVTELTFVNQYDYTYTATLDITKNVVRERGSRRPGKADFTFKASYVDPSNKEKEVLVELGSLTIKTTGGEKSYTEGWTLTIPEKAFNEEGWAVLVISEVNGKLSGWTYDKEVYTLYVSKNGGIFNGGIPQALNDNEEVVPGINLEFTNSYYKRTSSPNPPENKPVKSVKTGDMGIAMYAMTSLLSLGGAALVIKKRKDEE